MTVSQTRRFKEHLRMRQSIMNLTLDIFAKEGYENVSLNRIASSLDYTTSALYRYFEDKEEIFYRLYIEGFQLLPKYQERSRNISDDKQRLITHCQDYVKFSFEHREYYDIMFLLRAPIKKLIDKTEWRRVTSRTILYFRQDVQAVLGKKNPDPEVNITMLTIWSALHGLVSLTIRERLLPDTKYFRSTLHHMIESLISLHSKENNFSISVSETPNILASTMIQTESLQSQDKISKSEFNDRPIPEPSIQDVVENRISSWSAEQL